MIEKIIKALNINVTYTEKAYIPITAKRRARGASRWSYIEHRGEILLAKTATERTKFHEVGHIVNFMLGNGNRISDQIGIESEKFADIMADAIETLIKSAKQEKED